jgi:hypothetical protein
MIVRITRYGRYFALSFVLLLATVAGPQSSFSAAKRGPQSSQKETRKYGNPFDFWLHTKFNPDDVDYGERIEEMRAALIAGTVQSPFFWSIAWGVAMLLGSFAMVLHQERERKHRQLIAARFLAWYHNQLLDARERASEELEKLQRFRKAVDQRDMAAASGDTVAGNELMSEINSLRQKLSLMENTEKIVRAENTALRRLVRQGQPKNVDPNSGPAAAGKDDKNGK